MRMISSDTVVQAVRDLCITAACDLPEDVLEGIRKARNAEQSPQGIAILDQLIENEAIAAQHRMPICQDTGSAVFFVSVGAGCGIDKGTLTEAIEEGCRRGYREGYLRASIVRDPLFDRTNTRDNTPAFIHYDYHPGDTLSITVLPKGGGCENMSALRMLKPADGVEGIIDFVVTTVTEAGGNPCPPVIVGVGIGGTADRATLLAKKALLRNVGSRHADPQYAELETRLLTAVNATGNGPQGLGGTQTALAVHIETFPCHIASMPVAVNLNCHAARQATVVV